MSKLSNAIWKKRACRAMIVLTIISIVATFVLFVRFNFAKAAFPRLSWMQRTLGINQPDQILADFKPEIIGHRGSGLRQSDGKEFIGNTIRAIRKGINANVDWIEIDIRRSRDGVLMVFHDEFVGRTTNGVGRFSDLSRNELQALEINVVPAEKIPTLEEVLAEFSSGNAKFIFDIKAPNIHIQLLDLLKRHLSEDRIILFGTYDVLFEYTDCQYSLGYTALWSEGWNSFRFPFDHSFMLHRCEKLRCDYLILPNVFLNQALIKDSRLMGVRVWTYGSELTEDLRHSVRRGVTGFIVDQPSIASHAIQRR